MEVQMFGKCFEISHFRIKSTEVTVCKGWATLYSNICLYLSEVVVAFSLISKSSNDSKRSLCLHGLRNEANLTKKT